VLSKLLGLSDPDALSKIVMLSTILQFFNPLPCLLAQASQGGDPSPEPWQGDSRKIGPRMQEKALGLS